jgi:phosphinothricin acetyltransferase
MMEIRFASTADAAAMLEIYAPFETDTAISFEIEIPTLADFTRRIRTVTEKYPWLVGTIGSEVVGYAYGCSHRSRVAYRFSVESSVYLATKYHGHGLGTELYQRLFEELKNGGFKNAYAGITLPNESSVKLHTRFGFCEIGVFPEIGFKFDQWHDVAWFHKPLTVVPPTSHSN